MPTGLHRPAASSQLHNEAAILGKPGGEAEISFGHIDGTMTLAWDEQQACRRALKRGMPKLLLVVGNRVSRLAPKEVIQSLLVASKYR